MTKEELDQMVEEEAKRLGVGSSEFMQRHEEIMTMCDVAQRKEVKTNDKTVL